ncbi:MAG: class I SAM-dependent methyltransferase [Rhodospirillaceae bacterium]
MFDRRLLFQMTAAIGGAWATFATSGEAKAKLPRKADVEPRGTDRRLERLPTLDVESREDFLTRFRIWVNSDVRRTASKRANKIMKNKGLDPHAEITLEEAVEHLGDDHLVGLSGRAWISAQQIMWKNLQDEFHSNADAYLAEMEATDNIGPGKLELNASLDIPLYCKHEIHMQPGGYVGDPLGGYVYHYGTNNFWEGRNSQDEMDEALAKAVPQPKDGKIKRILHMGCSSGQLTLRLKELYPDAEVWGVDVGGPMVRYAHMRAVDLGIGANFRQALAEETRFPDGYFDIVTSFLLFHEVSSEGAEAIVNEGHRVLRPGGIFYSRDQRDWRKIPKQTAFQRYQSYWINRWNHEVWQREHRSNNYPELLTKAGFKVSAPGKGKSAMARSALMGIKTT